MKKLGLLIGLFGISSLALADNTDTLLSTKIDEVWVLVCAALVFFMQVGFLALEIGLSKVNSITSISLKNVIDFMIGFLMFLLFGFGLMFGDSFAGFIGTNLFALIDIESGNNPLKMSFFIFQVGFATASVTIVSGALSGRVGFFAYLMVSALVAGIIYPIFGHWVWGNSFFSHNPAWLSDMGYIDFAGSSVVHALGGWVALVGAYFVKPRLGRFSNTGKSIDFKPYSIAWTVLGVLILWLGWFGFNGGSLLAFDSSVGKIIINTSLSAVMSGITALFHAYFTSRASIYQKFLGGILAGLVAITASCHIMSLWGAALIGIGAGFVHNWGSDLLESWNIDDPVGAVPVHAFAGTFGVVIFPLFTTGNVLNLPVPSQLGIQLLGAMMCFIWSAGMSFIVFITTEKLVGLRVSPEEEKYGITIPNTLEVFAKQNETIQPSKPSETVVQSEIGELVDVDSLAEMMRKAEQSPKNKS